MSASKVAALVLAAALAVHTLAAQPQRAPRARVRPDLEQAREALEQTKGALDAIGPSLEGLSGLQGLQGLQELKGLDALQGLYALKGLDALKGIDALEGFEGLQGVEGLEGLRGLEGWSALDAVPFGSWDPDPSDPPFQQGPADSLYRSAREQLNAANYQRAAELFQRVVERYPRSVVAGDAMYWEAFARYQNGDYQRALDVLNRQADRYPNARTRRDAQVLVTRIRGQLALTGNSVAAESVLVAAAPRAPVASSAPVAPAAPVGPVAPTAPSAPGVASRRGARRPPEQIPGCEDPESDTRMAALSALLQMDSERALPILKQVLQRRDPCSVELRRKAMFLVSQKEGADVEDILLQSAQGDPDREVRTQAVFWLSQVNTERAVTALDSILLKSTDPEVQDKAIFALSQHQSARASEILRQFIDREDASDDLKAKAIFWLGQGRDDRGANVQYLKEIYPRLKSDELKEKVIFSIAQNDDPGSRQWLMDLALNGNESMEMRKKALFWAGQKGDVAIADLAKLYSNMADREMKEQLIFAYSQRQEPEAVDQLMAIAEKDPDKELRNKAIFWLGQSHDPRAAEFLLRLINR